MSKKQKLDLATFQKLARSFAHPLEGTDADLSMLGLGIAGEAGDLAGCIKKTLFHKNDQRAGTRENIGDSMWYLAMICNFYGWDFEEILAENVEKLRKRYPNGFTYEDAARKGERIDWNEK